MLRHNDVIYVRTVKKTGKWQNLFFTVNFLETSEFYRVCGKIFLEWIDKHTKKMFQIKRKNFM